MKKYEDIKFGKLVAMKVKGYELQIGDIIFLKYGQQMDRYAIIQRSYTANVTRQQLDVDDGNEENSPFRIQLDSQTEFFIWRVESSEQRIKELEAEVSQLRSELSSVKYDDGMMGR